MGCVTPPPSETAVECQPAYSQTHFHGYKFQARKMHKLQHHGNLPLCIIYVSPILSPLRIQTAPVCLRSSEPPGPQATTAPPSSRQRRRLASASPPAPTSAVTSSPSWTDSTTACPSEARRSDTANSPPPPPLLPTQEESLLFPLLLRFPTWMR